MSAANLQPIEAILGLVIDAIDDGIEVLVSGKPPVLDIPIFANLVGDLLPALSAIPKLPSSLAGFSESDGEALVNFVSNRLQVPNAHAQGIVNAVLSAAEAILKLVAGIKQAPAAPAPSAA